MKLELKSIKHSASLSEETEAFTANVYLDGKRAGNAQNRGNGGPTHVSVQPEFRNLMDENALHFLNIVDPNPVDYSYSPGPNDG